MTTARILFVTLMLSLFGLACTQAKDVQAPLKMGSPLFGFDVQKVTEITLAKSDPLSGDRWTAHLVRRDTGWQISSPERTLQDRLADHGLVDHLLDTLRTLHPTALAPKGPLDSYGLIPPVYALRLKIQDGNTAIQKEIHIGSYASKSEGDGRFAILPVPNQDTSEAFIIQGAALQMLGYLQSFDHLRRRVLLPFIADDVDEWELWKGTKNSFYAQRETDGWVDKNHLRPKVDAGAWLERFTHLRALHFIDEESEIQKIQAQLKRSPAYRAVFKDRQGVPTELRFFELQKRVYAVINSPHPARANTLFELFPESIHLFQAPQK